MSKDIRAALISAKSLDLNRAKRAQAEAGGPVGPKSAYMPGVPRQAHADGGAADAAELVAEMLRSGRHKDITNEHLNAADPQHLFRLYEEGKTGIKMPMDAKSRSERAEAMGMAYKGYHSSLEDKTKFNRHGQFFGHKGTSGISLTENPDAANRYLDRYATYRYDGKPFEKNVIPVAADLGRVVKRDEPYPSRGLLGSPLPDGYIPQHTNGNFYDTAQFPDAVSRNGPVKHSDAKNAIRSTETIMSDPTRVRSVFARFDPRLSHLSHLSASTGGAYATGGSVPLRRLNEVGLYSKAAEVARNLPQVKGTVDQMLAMMAKHGVKPAEMLHAGRPLGNTITREELSDHFHRASPRIRFDELHEDDEENQPQYSDYKTPDMSNYREHILQLPRQKNMDYRSPHWRGVTNPLLHTRLQDRTTPTEEYNHEGVKERLKPHIYYPQGAKRSPNQYLREAVSAGSITPEEAATYANVTGRGVSFMRNPGHHKKILHVDELQSDWGQEGRKKGFYDPKRPIEVFHTATGKTVHATDDLGEAKAKAIDLGPEYDYGDQSDDRVPSAPYVTNTQHWTDLGLKHILHQAAKGGYHGVSFASGQDNADRYGLEKQFGKLELRHNGTAEDPWADSHKSPILEIWGTNGNHTGSYYVNKPEDLSDLIGPDISKRLLADNPRPQHPDWSSRNFHRTIAGDDLRSGGEGMKAYYDNILPKSATRLLQQHDPEAAPTKTDNGNFMLPISEKARSSILAGQPMFAKGGTVGDAEWESDVNPHQVADAIGKSKGSSTLTQYAPEDIAHHLKAHKMKGKEAYFALQHGLDYGSEYGFSHPDLGKKEVGLTTVVNNEPDERGLGDQIVRGAIKHGATALDAFAVPSDKYPGGFLPHFYGKHGFRELGRVPFDPSYVSPERLKAMKEYWTSTGWDEGRHGMPSVAIMKLQKKAAGGEVDQPLEGMPTSIRVPATGEVIKAGPSLRIRQVARDYMAKAGLPYNPPTKYAKVNPERAKRIAAAFDQMKDDPDHPLVKASYAQMIKEAMGQYKAAVASGFKPEFWHPDRMDDPYGASPRLATEDVQKNNHMWVYPTMSGYGQGSITPEDIAKNPLLADSGERWKGHPVTMNDIFRAVHDYYGHAKEGVGFRHDGEENAWRAHASMFSPLARIAMTTETRGQNSWLNFGPHGDKNKNARTEDTVFADQKVGVLPHWVHHEGAEDFISPEDREKMAQHIKTYSRAAGGAVKSTAMRFGK
jgi:hypothetical protein